MEYLRKIRRKSLICIAITIGINMGAVGGAIAVGRWLDPYGFHHRPSFYPSPIANPARVPLLSYSYVGKAADIIRTKPTHIVLGTSVVDEAFRLYGSASRWYDPEPQKTEALIKSIDGDRSYYNAAVRGGSLYEAREFMEHAYKNNPRLSHVVLGMEWSTATHHPGPYIPPLALLGETHISLSAYLQYTASTSALEKAFDVLVGDNSPENAIYHNLALQTVAAWSASVDFLKKSRWLSIGMASRLQAPVAAQSGLPEALIVGSSPLELRRFVFSFWFVNQFKDRYDQGINLLLSVGPLDELKKIVLFCKQRDIDLDVFFAPQHPLFWAFIRRFDMEPAVNQWLRKVTEITPSWDFSDLIDYDDPDLQFNSDTLHANDKAGVIMMPVLHRPRIKVPQNVMFVSRNNVAAVTQHRWQMLTAWLNQHPELRAAIEAVPVEQVTTLPSSRSSYWPDLLPISYSPSYKSYNILRFIGMFYAIPSIVAPPYNLYTFLQHGYPDMLAADTLEDMLSEIDRRP
jgi:hypothetical protein